MLFVINIKFLISLKRDSSVLGSPRSSSPSPSQSDGEKKRRGRPASQSPSPSPNKCQLSEPESEKKTRGRPIGSGKKTQSLNQSPTEGDACSPRGTQELKVSVSPSTSQALSLIHI